MKKQLLKKLSAFIVTAMMFSASANAQIVYTDVNPDSSVVAPAMMNQTIIEQYNLDLNNDANSDFILQASANRFGGTYSYNVHAAPLNGNGVKDTLVDSFNVAIPLQLNALIDSNLLLQQSWQTSLYQKLITLNNSGTSGLWAIPTDYYLGLRLLQSGQTYYGWVKLRVSVSPGGAAVTIKDYAYNSIPDQPILAGQTTATGIIENSFAASINLFPNPADDHLTIAMGSINKNVEVIITDITGKIIYTTAANQTNKIELNTSEFAEGIYVVQIQAADFIGTKKLVVEKYRE